MLGGHGTPRYVLITPLRNECHNIIRLKDTVMAQTVRPVSWVVAVDSNSTDGSYESAQTLLGSEEWIEVVESSTPASEGYGPQSFARTVNAALDRAMTYDGEYIGKTDAHVALDHNYFEILISEMQRDNNLAICCGIQNMEIRSHRYSISSGRDDPLVGFNDIRLYRRSFLRDVGGYPICYQPDTVLLVKAIVRGMRTQVFPQVSFTTKRQGGTKIGQWKGNMQRGRGLYSIGYPPLYALLFSLYYSRFPPHYQYLAMITGYLSGVLDKEKIKDQEVVEYLSRRDLITTLRSVFEGNRIKGELL